MHSIAETLAAGQCNKYSAKTNVLAQLYIRNMCQCIMVGTFYLLNYQL